MGPNRIRCVCVTASGAGSRFEGITFYRGAALHDPSATDQGCGGGIFIANNKGVTAVDCAFRECQARNGSGMCSMASCGRQPAVRADCLTGTVNLVDGRYASKDEIGVDAGDPTLLPEDLAAMDDLAGAPRVLNGCVDVGAYEYDWRVDYSQTLAKRSVTVTDVTPEAHLVDRSLTWTDGEVALDWAGNGWNAPYSFTVTVSDGASLDVTLNGVLLGSYGPGTQTVTFDSSEQLNRLSCLAHGTAAISVFEHSAGTLLLFR